ncbi:uncharacterized protein LOC112094448 [Morus notabilis]|uniref:uncharacterized protein LOC112094448 n=1 Tax=Morus notabilis TaxID=981085 RepID=UPI000CED7A21|nr:uncharacterized protein LOC112094448 [Morus notabilis]
MTQAHHRDTIVAATPKQQTGSTQACHRCGRTNHLLANCKARFHSNGTRLSDSHATTTTTSSSSTALCLRCGRTNHHVEQCKAVYLSNGTRLSGSRTTTTAVTANTDSVTTESFSDKFTFSTDDLQALINQDPRTC